MLGREVPVRKRVTVTITAAPGWWNWQTRRSQTPLLERACGFKSRSGHGRWSRSVAPTRVPRPGPTARDGRRHRLGMSSTGNGRARDQFGRSASSVPGTLGRSTTPNRSSRVAAASTAGLAPMRRWTASATRAAGSWSGVVTSRCEAVPHRRGAVDAEAHPRQGRQVVGGHHRQGLAGPLLRRRILEPDEPRRQDAGLVQRLAVARLDRAEILPDDHRGGAGALEGDELQQLTAGKADVHPIGRGPAVRDPEEPGQAHHVVDAKPTAADHRGPKDLRERAVPACRGAGSASRAAAPIVGRRARTRRAAHRC